MCCWISTLGTRQSTNCATCTLFMFLPVFRFMNEYAARRCLVQCESSHWVVLMCLYLFRGFFLSASFCGVFSCNENMVVSVWKSIFDASFCEFKTFYLDKAKNRVVWDNFKGCLRFKTMDNRFGYCHLIVLFTVSANRFVLLLNGLPGIIDWRVLLYKFYFVINFTLLCSTKRSVWKKNDKFDRKNIVYGLFFHLFCSQIFTLCASTKSIHFERDVIFSPNDTAQAAGKIVHFDPIEPIDNNDNNKETNYSDRHNDESSFDQNVENPWLEPLKHALYLVLNNKINKNSTSKR